MVKFKDVLLEDYLDRNKDLRQCDVAEQLGMTPAVISRRRKSGDFWIRLSDRGSVLGHYIFKDLDTEIERREKVERKRKRLRNKRKRELKSKFKNARSA